MKKYSVVGFIVLFMYMLVSGAVALSESTFFSLYTSGMTNYLIADISVFAVFGFCIMWLYRKSDNETSVFGTSMLSTTMMLNFGTSIMLILVFFLSGSTLDGMIEISQKIVLQTFILIFASVIAFFGIMLLKFLEKKYCVLCLIIFDIVSVVTGAVMAFFNSNGSTIIGNIQVGLIACYLAIVHFAVIIYSCSNNRMQHLKKPRIIQVISAICLFGLFVGYFVSGEYGISSFLIVSGIIWYIFYNRRKVKKINLTLILIILVTIAIVAVMVYYYFVKSGMISKEAFWYLGEKIGRMFEPKNSTEDIAIQRNSALARLATAGIFGTYDYSYVSAATTDYSIAITTHYSGWLWFVIMLASFCFTVVQGNKYWHKNKSDFKNLETISCISFIYIFLVSFYNILSNVGITGIIGVSCFASGYGYSNSLLSGLLLGSVIYNLWENTRSQDLQPVRRLI